VTELMVEPPGMSEVENAANAKSLDHVVPFAPE
jgi:hypothetical protein